MQRSQSPGTLKPLIAHGQVTLQLQFSKYSPLITQATARSYSSWDDRQVPLTSVAYRTIHDLPWEPLLADRGASSLGPVWKTLTEDPETGGTTYVVHPPPGWRTDILDWHPYVEEVFGLAGGISQGDRWHGAGYVYRPPETLHGPYQVTGPHGYTVLHRRSRSS